MAENLVQGMVSLSTVSQNSTHFNEYECALFSSQFLVLKTFLYDFQSESMKQKYLNLKKKNAALQKVSKNSVYASTRISGDN
jgi:hypothetical protein